MSRLPFRFYTVASVFACALSLGACALPLPMQVASLVADGFSLMTTNKTMADHAVSAALEKDCSFMRGLGNDGQICDEDDAAPPSAALENSRPAAVAREEPDGFPAAFETAAGSPLPAARPTTAAAPSGRYWIIGSFAREKDARRMAARHGGLEAKVVAGRARGKQVWRVAVGPFQPEDQDTVQTRIAGFGIRGAWAARL